MHQVSSGSVNIDKSDKIGYMKIVLGDIRDLSPARAAFIGDDKPVWASDYLSPASAGFSFVLVRLR